ncbi:MAG TPA: Rieske (2Fe-2S) protein [Baekduia sp.]
MDVGAEDEFAEAVIRVVSVDGRDVGVLRWRGGWYAMRNICPHLGAPLCVGPLQAFLTVDDPAGDEIVVDPTRPMLMCPWHRWEFDLSTGQSVGGKERVKTYPVRVQDGRVLVDLGARRAATAGA